MAYKHKITQGLADLIEKYGGGGKDPMMKAVWWGIKGQIPSLLQSLDENDEAIEEIRKKLMDVLDIPPSVSELPIPGADKVVFKPPEEEAPIEEPEAPREEKEVKPEPKKKKKSKKSREAE